MAGGDKRLSVRMGGRGMDRRRQRAAEDEERGRGEREIEVCLCKSETCWWTDEMTAGSVTITDEMIDGCRKMVLGLYFSIFTTPLKCYF